MLSKKEQVLVGQSLDRYCQERIPAHARDKVRLTYRSRGQTVTLIEERHYFQDPKRWTSHPVAQFRYEAIKKRWTLYCADRNRRWHRYERTPPATSVQTLIDEVNRDPTGMFWG